MSTSSFQKPLTASTHPTECSPLNAPLQQYPLLHAVPSNNPNFPPNSSSRASPSPPPRRTGPSPCPVPPGAGPWISPTPSSDSCNAASARNGHDSTATDGGRTVNEGIFLEGKLIRLFYCRHRATQGTGKENGRERDWGRGRDGCYRNGLLGIYDT